LKKVLSCAKIANWEESILTLEALCSIVILAVIDYCWGWFAFLILKVEQLVTSQTIVGVWFVNGTMYDIVSHASKVMWVEIRTTDCTRPYVVEFSLQTISNGWLRNAGQNTVWIDKAAKTVQALYAFVDIQCVDETVWHVLEGTETIGDDVMIQSTY